MHTIQSLHARATAATMAALFASALLVAPPAVAAADSDVTWSVTPADDSGPDGRGVIEQELDPGESREDHLAVKNLSRSEVTFTLSAADGYYTDKGRFNMLPSDQESVDAGRWIELPESVTVQPNATVVVPFTTRVPDDAIPGDHAAGIAASVMSSGTDASGSQVGVESRVGFRVMTRVTGEIVPGFEVTGTAASYDLSWNPFQAGAAAVTFEVRNTGNASVVLGGEVTAGTGSVDFPGADAVRQELLPGDSRAFTVVVPDVWPTVFVPGAVALAPTAYDLGGAPVEVAPQTTPVTIWAVPVSQLLVVIGVALILVPLLWRRRRFAAALAAAREEGRASVSTPSPELAEAGESAEVGSRRARRVTPEPPLNERAP